MLAHGVSKQRLLALRIGPMPSPWLSIPLEDYEGHMGSAGVGQLTALSELFRCALEYCLPASVAMLGIAGGNGLERIDSAVTKRIVGVDVNQRYLEAVRRRFGTLPGLELHCRDLAGGDLNLAPVDLVHAALIFEHAGAGRALENAISLVAAEGRLSVVLQLPSESEEAVAETGFLSIQTLKRGFALIDASEFQCSMVEKGFRLVEQRTRQLPAGKAFLLGVFGRAGSFGGEAEGY
jgi:hypothetical protein